MILEVAAVIIHVGPPMWGPLSMVLGLPSNMQFKHSLLLLSVKLKLKETTLCQT